MGSDERAQAFARCEACGSSATGKHAAGVGGGWAELCAACAARLCACGAFVVAAGETSVDDLDAKHGLERCHGAGLDGKGWEVLPPDGCRCDVCDLDRARLVVDLPQAVRT